MSKPSLREAITPLVVGVAAAAATFLVDHVAQHDLWVTALGSGLGAWLGAFGMTGRWK
jgi:hypothetical protein